MRRHPPGRTRSMLVSVVTTARSHDSVPLSFRPRSARAVGTLFVQVTPVHTFVQFTPDHVASCEPVAPTTALRKASSADARLGLDAGGGDGGGKGGGGDGGGGE